MKLYGYFRSSTTYRTRIALNLKGLDYEIVPVNLLTGEQRADAFAEINPFRTVPSLEIDGVLYSQSIAILAALDDLYPDPSLLPSTPDARRKCRELGYAIASEIHAPNNLRVLKYLRVELGLQQEQINKWYSTWVRTTFEPIEKRLQTESYSSPLPFGDTAGLFEIMLVPQLYNAQRFGVDLSDFPKLNEIEQACLEMPAFQRAHPDNQPDSPTP